VTKMTICIKCADKERFKTLPDDTQSLQFINYCIKVWCAQLFNIAVML